VDKQLFEILRYWETNCSANCDNVNDLCYWNHFPEDMQCELTEEFISEWEMCQDRADFLSDWEVYTNEE